MLGSQTMAVCGKVKKMSFLDLDGKRHEAMERCEGAFIRAK